MITEKWAGLQEYLDLIRAIDESLKLAGSINDKAKALEMQARGNQMKIVDNSGDGNCQFEALSHQFSHHLHQDRGHRELRYWATDYLGKNRETVSFWY